VLTWLTTSALRFGRLAVAAALGLLAIGLVQLRGAPVDVYPEFEPPAIQVQAEALGLSAQEVEQLITVPLEQDLLNGVPWVEHIRSESMPGLSAIELSFEPGTDLYQARQMVQERMTQAKALPNVGTPPIMVQPTSSTSRVAMIAMTSQTVPTMQMSVLARWQIRPRLMSIPGVANVSVWGQRDRQLQVQVDPERLRRRDVTLTELIESTGNALWVSPLSFVEASTPGTGGFVETPNQRLGVQHVQPITTAEQLAHVAVEGRREPALTIGDVASVREDHQPLIGDASVDGTPGLMLVVERFPDADTAGVTRDVEAALEAMGPGLAGITLDPQVFRPASYLSSALDGLGKAGLASLALFTAALAVLLLSWRLAVIAVVAVPLSLTAAAYVLHLRGQTLTTMTLVGLAGALAVVVDDVVGDVTEIGRRLQRGGTPVTTVVQDVVAERRGPLLLGTVIVLLVLTPLLLVGGLTTAFSAPVVLTYALAVGSSFVVALVLTPALAVLLFRGREHRVDAGPLARRVGRAFDRIVAPSLTRPLRGLLAAALLAVLGLAAASQSVSGRVLPPLQDHNLLVRIQAAPGTALAETDRVVNTMAKELRTVSGVASAGAHVGRAVNADEVVDVNAAEIWVTVAPEADYGATVGAVRSAVRGYPGLRSSVHSYAEDRVAAARESTGDQLVVRVYGQDLTVLREAARDVGDVLGTVRGLLSPQLEAQVSVPTVEIEVDLAAAQRHGLRPGDVRREASTLISGLTVGSLYEEQKIFDVVVWGGQATRQSVAGIRSLVIDTPAGGHVRLGEVARVRVRPNPVSISHDSVSRSIDVTASVTGRKAGEVASEVTDRLRGLALPYEYRAEVLTDAADREDAQQRMVLIALGVAALVLLLLQAATGSWRAAAILFGSLPLAVTGGLLVAPFVGGVDSLGVVAALVAVLAVAVRHCLWLVRGAQRLRDEHGAAAVGQAARQLAPSVVGAALVTAAVLLAPAVLSGSAGLEILAPFAFTMLGGLLSAIFVVLFVVPTLLQSSAGRQPAAGPAADPGHPAEEASS
jgi:Cu/Ag efflux pump CusA